MGAVFGGGRVDSIDLVAGVEVVVDYVGGGMKKDDSQNRDGVPEIGDVAVGGGEQYAHRDGDDGHGEGPGTGGDEIFFHDDLPFGN